MQNEVVVFVGLAQSKGYTQFDDILAGNSNASPQNRGARYKHIIA
jgi:hypothetical protein